MDEGILLLVRLVTGLLELVIAAVLIVVAVKAVTAIIKTANYLEQILTILQRQEKRNLQDRANRKIMQSPSALG